MRLSKDQYALCVAAAAALRSEDPHLKVGACALNYEGRILATGYNGLSPGALPAESFWDDRDAKSRYMIHAEMNLCALFRRGEVELVALTHSPCAACARVLAASGVKRVIFAQPYDRDPEALEVLRFHFIQYQYVPAPILKYETQTTSELRHL